MSDPGPTWPTDPAGEPLRNTALVEAMEAVARDDRPQARALLFQLLLESTVVVATQDAGPPGTRTMAQGEHLQLITATDDEGLVVPMFTSTDALLRWIPAGSPYIALPASALAEMVASGPPARIVVDPGSQTWGIITEHEVEALARGRLPVTDTATSAAGVQTEVVATETKVRIGQPAEGPPPEVVDALGAALAAQDAIDAGYLALMQVGEQEPEVVVGIHLLPATDSATGDAAVHAVMARIADVHPYVQQLRFLHLEDDLRDTLAAGAGIELFVRPGS